MKKLQVPGPDALRRVWREDRLPFLSALLVGLAAHGYAFTNKLVNHDEIESLFGKGATVTSGRWGLELVKLLFPDWSMPWIYGLLSLLLISAAACLMLRFLRLRTTAMRILLPALVAGFPSLTGNFCFMFTSAPYAWSFFLAVLAVCLFRWGKPARMAGSLVLLVLALGIYQAYISVAATLFLLSMLADALDNEKSVGQIVLDGVKALALMAAAIAVYYCVTLLVFRFTGAEFNSYVTENVNGAVSIPRRIRMAYDAFFYIFRFRHFSLITSEASRWLHILLVVATIVCMTPRMKKPLQIALIAALTLLLPLSICCMFLIMSEASIHTLVMYGFVCLYFWMSLVIERLEKPAGGAVRSAYALLLAAVALGNVYFANKCYLKLQLQYENAYAFYTSLAAQIRSTEGFDENTRLALVGRQDNLIYDFPELDTEEFLGVNRDLINVYSRENFFRYYLGFEIPFADEAEIRALEEDPQVLAMAEYPYYGSVKKIGDLIVVRLG